jgi:hypothetical protein
MRFPRIALFLVLCVWILIGSQAHAVVKASPPGQALQPDGERLVVFEAFLRPN